MNGESEVRDEGGHPPDGIGILLVEQNASMAPGLADRACVFEVGSIVLEGPASAVAGNERVRTAYLGG
jgi:branched-chain amino acid transport system ATP-binding protein